MRLSSWLVLGLASAADVNTFESRLVSEGTKISIVPYLRGLYKLFNIKSLSQAWNQLADNPTVKLRNPTRFRPESRDVLLKGLEMGYLTMCPATDILSFKCICDTDYSDVSFAYDPEVTSRATILYNKNSKQAVVSFRYTTGARNWMTNFDFVQVQMKGAPEGARVHRGMYEYYLTINDQIMNQVKQLSRKKEVRSVFVTGYSLGGSIAVMSLPFWSKFKRETGIPVSIVSFAGARTGNLPAKVYFESLGIPVVRYTNLNDIVPQLPPRWANYTHVGLEVHERNTRIPGKTELIVCRQDYDEDENCSLKDTRFPSALRHLAPFNNLLLLPPYCGQGSLTNNQVPEYNYSYQ